MTKFFIAILLLLICTSPGKARKKHKMRNNRNSTVRDVSEIETKSLEVTVKIPKAFSKSTHRSLIVNPIEANCNAVKKEYQDLRKELECKPRQTIINLRSDSNSTLIPNAVPAYRCSGWCSGFHKCVPVETKNVTYYVKTIKKNKVQCTSINISEDTKCECSCQQRATDCTRYQTYEHSLCSCVCKDTAEQEKCQNRRNKQWSWNEKECRCVCQEKRCSTGSTWNQKTCRCTKG